MKLMKQVCSNLSSWSCENFWLIWILSWSSFYNPQHLLDYLSFCLFRALLSLQWWPLQMKIENPLNILHVIICCCLGAVPKDPVCLHFHFLGNFKHSSFYKKLIESEWNDVSQSYFLSKSFKFLPLPSRQQTLSQESRSSLPRKIQNIFEFSGK